MQPVIVCGSACSELEQVQALLRGAGVADPLPALTGGARSIAAWHDRFFSSVGPAPRPAKPTRSWELAASEIFLANSAQAVWGWADSRSTWLLDFWSTLDSNSRFVLLCTSPEQAVVNSIANPALPPTADAALRIWQSTHSELLRFYSRHQSRCVLVNASEAANRPAALLKTLVERIQLPIETAVPSAERGIPIESSPAILFAFVARQLIKDDAETRALHNEITACATSLLVEAADEEELKRNAAADESREAVAQLRELLKAKTLLPVVQQQAEALNRTKLALEAAQDAQARRWAEEQRAAQATHREMEGRVSGLQRLCNAMEAKLQLAATDSANLQRQCEMLTSALRARELEVQEAIGARDAHTRTVGELTRLVESTQAELHAARTEGTAKAEQVQKAEESRRRLERENHALLEQLDQVQQELERSVRLAEEQQVQAREHAQKIDELTHLLQTAQADLQAGASEVAAKAGLVASTEDLFKRQQHENELLLQQLDQVQQELENYFTLYQHQQTQFRALEARWLKAMARYPEHFEWEAIEPVAVSETKRSPTVRWQATGLALGGRMFPEIEVTTRAAGERVSLVLEPDGERDQPVTVELPAPRKRPNSNAPQNVSTTDWFVVHAFSKALRERLQRPFSKAELAPDALVWVRRLDEFEKHLRQQPPDWRYDGVTLKHEQVNPDYEHLWFRLTNASYGPAIWPEFEFRLSAAHVKRGKFSTHPKLEFPLPERGAKQFENWFHESEDERGPKYELRFELKNAEMDMHAWSALSSQDQAQLQAIVARLPDLLETLAASGTRISRPWADWQELAAGLITTMNTRLRFSVALDPALSVHE